VRYAFFDTSALVKRYYEKPGTETVDAIVEDDDTTVVITSLSIIEAVSAFRRKYNAEEISRSAVEELVAVFFEEALADFSVLPTRETLFDRSLDLVLDDDLRTLDSLQLSAALALRSAVDDVSFVCADEELVAITEQRGFEAIDPTIEDY
jgi:predicted nucleic acid-binding protein